MICDKGHDIETCVTSTGHTPITLAASLNLDEVVNYLSLRVKKIDVEDPQQMTPFMRFALFNHFEMANKMILRGADVNFNNKLGKTALVLACEQQRLGSI